MKFRGASKMSEEKYKLLICDDQEDICYILDRYLELCDSIEVCGCAHDGVEALKKIEELEPDVVLLDIIMPKLDGMSVLRKLNECNIKKIPKVIMLSGMVNSNIMKQSLDLGASYYLNGPVDRETLINSIEMVANTKNTNTVVLDRNHLGTFIRKFLSKLNVPTHMVGYLYISQALQIMLEKDYLGNLWKYVYSEVAAKNSTTPECVESSIRKAIIATTKRESDLFKELFWDKYNTDQGIKRPTNCKFLTKACERILLEVNM